MVPIESMITKSEWADFAADAVPGDSIVYYHGWTPSGLWGVFEDVGAAADAGDFLLTQKVVGVFQSRKGEVRIFEYRAERISSRAWRTIDNLRNGPNIFSAFRGGSA